MSTTLQRGKSKRRKRCGSLFQRGGAGAWIAQWTGHDGKPKWRSTRTSDRQAAERILAKWTGDSALRREGVVDVTLERLAKEGRRPIAEHLQEWRRFMEGKGNAPKHIAQYVKAATETLAAAKVETIAAISSSGIVEALSGICGGDASNRTKNHHLGAVRAFCRWCVRERRLSLSPLAGIAEWNLQTDRRRVRRTFDPAELERIIIAAKGWKRVQAMEGPDRAMLYLLAAGTGFRANELASLTPERFDLDGEPPTITVLAGSSKRRREDRQPIRPDLADALRPWLAGKPSGVPVFARRMDKTAAMLRADLRRAWYLWVTELPPGRERRERRRTLFLREADDDGRVADFHSLRAFYVTALVKGGATVKVAQTLARHSTPVLTMNVYSRLGVHDLTGALAALPDLSGPGEAPRSEAQVLRATGTDGPADPARSGKRSEPLATHCNASQPDGPRMADYSQDDGSKNPGKEAGNATHCNASQRISTKPPRGLEPRTCRLQISRSAN